MQIQFKFIINIYQSLFYFIIKVIKKFFLDSHHLIGTNYLTHLMKCKRNENSNVILFYVKVDMNRYKEVIRKSSIKNQKVLIALKNSWKIHRKSDTCSACLSFYTFKAVWCVHIHTIYVFYILFLNPIFTIIFDIYMYFSLCYTSLS